MYVVKTVLINVVIDVANKMWQAKYVLNIYYLYAYDILVYIYIYIYICLHNCISAQKGLVFEFRLVSFSCHI